MTPTIEQLHQLYAQEIKTHLLALREALIRHDENLAALHLVNHCVPYFLDTDSDVQAARERTIAQTLHLTDQKAYEVYYGVGNVYERPFEEQYGIAIAEAARIPRVAWLAQRLRARALYPLHLDLGANDGWMLAYLLTSGIAAGGTGIDLSYDATTRANHTRDVNVYQGRIEDFDQQEQFNSVSCFEVLEHVADPDAVLAVAYRALVPGGVAFFSTPYGACELGCLPYDWDRVEPKGHVRAWTPEMFEDHVAAAGFDVKGIAMDSHDLMLCEATR